MFKIEEINTGGQVDLHQEAKNIVLEEMENFGMIAKMKAQIKSNVLRILEKQKTSLRQNVEFDYMTPLHRQNKTKEVLLAYHIVKEFMQFYELEYTLPIFENESNIRENIKRETLLSELSLPNISQSEPKPVIIQLITSFHANLQNKKNIENISQKLDDSYGVKSNNMVNLENLSYHDKSNTLSYPKKQLAPINFANKSIDLKDTSSPSNKNYSEHESFKFNTANINDILNKDNSTKNTLNNQYNPVKNEMNTNENKNLMKENKNSEKNGDGFKFQYNSAEYNTNNKYDDEFNEVILEEINEGKVNIKNKEEDIDDSKKSFTGNSNNNLASSMGYDSSITNYKLDEFDHIEEVDIPIT